MRKLIRKWWFWCIFAALVFVANVLYAIFAPESDIKASLLSTMSGWVSGIATIVIGVIAAIQSQQYNKIREEQERSVDLVVESMQIVNHPVPGNVLGREFTNKLCNNKIALLLYNINDKPIFNIKAVELRCDKETLIYDLCSPETKDMYGKSFLIKNEKFHLHIGFVNEKYTGECSLKITFENQYGDLYEKVVDFWLENNVCYRKEKQGKTRLIRKEKENG